MSRPVLTPVALISAVLVSAASVAAPALAAPVDAANAGHHHAAPVVTALGSNHGASVGYTHVVIHGRGFTGSPHVTFGGRPAANVHVLSTHTMVVYAPGHKHGTVQVRVRTKAGTSPKSEQARYTYVHQVQPGTWRTRTAPVPPGEPADDFVSRTTSCPTTTVCYSVGYYSAADQSVYAPSPLVSTRNSGHETTRRAPLPAGVPRNSATLYEISCPAVGSCVAAGQYNGGHHSVVLVLANGTWTASKLDLHEGSGQAEIYGLSCGAPGECTAIGYQSDQFLDTFSPVLVRLHNGTWTTTDVVAPGSANSKDVTLDDIDCASASYCLAAGQYGGGTYVDQVIDGVQTVRVIPKSAQDGRPTGVGAVQCPAVGRCTVLLDFRAGHKASAFASVDNGSQFTFSHISFPPDADLVSTLFAYQARMSCPAVSVCYAANGYDSASGYAVASVASLVGTTTHFYNLPRPSPKPDARTDVSDIDCATRTACTAVGTTHRVGSGVTPGEDLGAYFTFADGVWTVQAAKAAPGQKGRPTSAGFTSVECPAAGQCLANGDYQWDRKRLRDDDGFHYYGYVRDSGLVALETPN